MSPVVICSRSEVCRGKKFCQHARLHPAADACGIDWGDKDSCEAAAECVPVDINFVIVRNEIREGDK